MATKTCPDCGASMGSNRTTCPACRRVLKAKSSLPVYIIIAVLVVIAIVSAAFFMMNSPSQPVTIPNPVIPPTVAASSGQSQPTCTIAITGSKVPPSSIRLQVMASTCSAGDVTGLRVSVNGLQEGTLGTSPGASGTFAGTAGTNTVTVVAKYSTGAENVVYQNAAL